jgi:hypothetical protein
MSHALVLHETFKGLMDKKKEENAKRMRGDAGRKMPHMLASLTSKRALEVKRSMTSQKPLRSRPNNSPNRSNHIMSANIDHHGPDNCASFERCVISHIYLSLCTPYETCVLLHFSSVLWRVNHVIP